MVDGQNVKLVNNSSVSDVSENAHAVSHILEDPASSMSVRRFQVRAKMWYPSLDHQTFHRKDVVYDIRLVTPD